MIPGVPPFFAELVERLRQVPLRDLPAVAAAIDRASAEPSSRAAKPKSNVNELSELAAALATMPIAGSKLDAVIDAVVLHAAEVTGGNQSAAARLLGMERKAYGRRLKSARARARARSKSKQR